jgi:hypothetical protein
MDHQKIQTLLLTLDFPGLSPEEHRKAMAHIQECAECRGLFVRWERIQGVLSSAGAVTAPEGMVHKVMGRLADLEADAGEPAAIFRPLPQWLYPSLGYAFAFLLMFVAIAHWEPYLNASPSTETVLLSSIPQGEQSFYAQEPPEIDHLFIAQ